MALVDKAEIKNNWVLKIANGVTKSNRVETSDDFGEVLHQLGAVPSDVLAKDFVLFVEGRTEAHAVVPSWASTLGLELEGNMKVGVIPVGGGSRLADNLRIWLEIMKHAPAEFHVMADNHSAGDVVRLARQFSIDQSRFTVLPGHGIEDFYPPSLIADALTSIYKIQKLSYQQFQSQPRDRVIRAVLEENNLREGNRWKVPVGLHVASRMTKDQIPTEFKAVCKLMVEAIS